jgi:hypothetical protein
MCKYINILLCLFLFLFKVEGNEETAPVVIIVDVTWLALISCCGSFLFKSKNNGSSKKHKIRFICNIY